jgi:hypothetical protein
MKQVLQRFLVKGILAYQRKSNAQEAAFVAKYMSHLRCYQSFALMRLSLFCFYST